MMTENQPEGAPENEDSFEELFNKSFQEQARLEPGQMIEAVVVNITPDWIFLDVGRKGEGYLDKKEMLDKAGNLSVKEGDKVRAYYLPAAGQEMHFTTKIGSGPIQHAQLEDAWRNGIPVEGTVVKETKGGFEVKIGGGVRAFCPFSQSGLRREEDRAGYIGKSLEFKIIECAARNVVLSRKAILDSEKQDKARALQESLKEGMKVDGTVTSIQAFGAFVDIGGFEGLIPISEIAWDRTEKVEDKLSVGEAVEVVVKKLDWENGRISFSRKDALPDPWDRAQETWALGSYHNGAVTRLAPFGAFVAMGEGVEGLIHISKLGAGKRISHPREVLREGQAVEVRVESVDRETRRLALSLGDISRGEEEDAAFLKVYQERSSAAPENLGTLGDMLKARMEQEGKDEEDEEG
ncbi:MAG: 30S ribosomal protein S1 [Elusimicrobiota bacterium]